MNAEPNGTWCRVHKAYDECPENCLRGGGYFHGDTDCRYAGTGCRAAIEALASQPTETAGTVLVPDASWHRVLAIARGNLSDDHRKTLEQFREAAKQEAAEIERRAVEAWLQWVNEIAPLYHRVMRHLPDFEGCSESPCDNANALIRRSGATLAITTR